MNEYTDGPWRYEPKEPHGRMEKCIWGPKGDGYGTVCTVANLGLRYTEEERLEQIANARLIAAAPDLYEALKAALHYLPALTKVGLTDADRDILNLILQALAKAEGR